MSFLQACLFDLDGVIVDTAKYHYQAWRRMANQLNFELTIEQNEQLKGISRMESLDIILAFGGVELDELTRLRLAAEKNVWYLQLCQQMSPIDVLPGVREFVEELKSNGIRIGLGSASKNAVMILDRIGMLSYFETIVDGNRITRGKPDPEIFLIGAADLHVPPNSCVVFEDAVAGVQAAKAGGMKAVGVGDAAVLHEADVVIAGFEGYRLEFLQPLFRV